MVNLNVYVIWTILLLILFSHVMTSTQYVINARFFAGCGFSFNKKRQMLDKLTKEMKKVYNTDISFKMSTYKKDEGKSDFNLFVYKIDEETGNETETLIATSNSNDSNYFPFLEDSKESIDSLVNRIQKVIVAFSSKEVKLNRLIQQAKKQ